MTTEAEKQLYPLSTQEGNFVPLEVAEAIAYASIAFTNVATSPLAFPSKAEVIMVLATEPCLIAFGKPAAIPADATFDLDVAMIPKDSFVYLVIPKDKETISVIRDGTVNGTIRVQVYRAWKALKQTLQQF